MPAPGSLSLTLTRFPFSFPSIPVSPSSVQLLSLSSSLSFSLFLSVRFLSSLPSSLSLGSSLPPSFHFSFPRFFFSFPRFSHSFSLLTHSLSTRFRCRSLSLPLLMVIQYHHHTILVMDTIILRHRFQDTGIHNRVEVDTAIRRRRVSRRQVSHRHCHIQDQLLLLVVQCPVM